MRISYIAVASLSAIADEMHTLTLEKLARSRPRCNAAAVVLCYSRAERAVVSGRHLQSVRHLLLS